jgi:hypothetical protein
MGMRGSGDTGSSTLNATALEDVIAQQQIILASVVNSNFSGMWCPYKEVGCYYQKGMKVLDDITILWPDDNVGNIQRLPIPSELNRSGGAGYITISTMLEIPEITSQVDQYHLAPKDLEADVFCACSQ